MMASDTQRKDVRIAEGSAWDRTRIERYLADSRLPCRLACVTGDGYPHVTSLWFLYTGGEVQLSMQQDAWVPRWLADNPRCGFEVAVNEPPYAGVRGRGVARLARAGEAPSVLPELVDRYLGERDSELARWLLSRLDTEVTIRVTPEWLTSWDYGNRMEGGAAT